MPQTIKDLVNTLINCRGTFEVNISKCSVFIYDVVAFTLTEDKDNGMYCVRINTENNTKDLFIAKANVTNFTVHFS